MEKQKKHFAILASSLVIGVLIAVISLGLTRSHLNLFPLVALGDAVSGSARGDSENVSEGHERGSIPSDFKDPRLRELFFNRLSPDATIEDFHAFLAAKGRSPEALALVALATRDPGVLSELEKKAKESPIAGQVLFIRSGSPIDRLTWANALVDSDPHNSLGFLYKSRALFELGDQESALRFLEHASNLDFKEHIREACSLTPDQYNSIPYERSLEIAFADGPGWFKDSIRPAFEALRDAALISGDGDGQGSSRADIDLLESLVMKLKSSSDPQVLDSVNHMSMAMKWQVLESIRNPETKQVLQRAWGDIEQVRKQWDESLIRVTASTGNLADLSPSDVRSRALEWFTGGDAGDKYRTGE
jgi:hypothetical protein